MMKIYNKNNFKKALNKIFDDMDIINNNNKFYIKEYENAKEIYEEYKEIESNIYNNN